VTRRLAAALVATLGLWQGAWATPPEISPRPEARAEAAQAPAPGDPARRADAIAGAGVVSAVSGTLLRSPRPVPRPGRGASAMAAAVPIPRQPQPPAATGLGGAVCGDPAIVGVAIPAIEGRLDGCGVAAPVRVTAIAGVALSMPSTMDCPTAQALKTWLQRGAVPAVGRMGGGIARLEVAGAYACRPRNNRKGAKISEHGKGRAIDIAAIGLRDGSLLRVQADWTDRRRGKVLRAMHRAACGPFGTVLGPGADAEHQDHFHFDTARYRGGSYCR